METGGSRSILYLVSFRGVKRAIGSIYLQPPAWMPKRNPSVIKVIKVIMLLLLDLLLLHSSANRRTKWQFQSSAKDSLIVYLLHVRWRLIIGNTATRCYKLACMYSDTCTEPR